MKWYPAQAKKGDMIRVHLGGICHYGIFVSEEEVIQFGLPPLPKYRADGAEITVCATDIDVFSCGQTVEVAKPELKERLKKHSAEKTVKLARSRLGEGGYHLLHNNCEHFVYECAYGISLCTQENDARERWNNRPILDVYLLPLSASEQVGQVYPPAREKYIRDAENEEVRLQRYAAWKLLENAVSHSFDYPFSDLRFHRAHSGKWTCDRLQFSLAHCQGAVAVAVSNGNVGVDVENVEAFSRKYADSQALSALKAHTLTAQERAQLTDAPEAFLQLWTKKESLFKCGEERKFAPEKIDTHAAQTCTKLLAKLPLCVSVCGEHLSHVRWYLVCDGVPRLLFGEAFRNGNETL